MEKSSILVMLDCGHGSNTPGKQSPDKRLREWSYVRTICAGIAEKLFELGIEYYFTHPEEKEIGGQSNDLILRVNRANAKYKEMKSKGRKAILISVHCNAAGSGGVWRTGKGWEAYTSVGQTAGDKLADSMYAAANEILPQFDVRIRTDKSDGDPDKEANFYVLRKSNCPAVLTENLFMDNKEECEWLLSDEGKEAIIDIHVQGILHYIENN